MHDSFDIILILPPKPIIFVVILQIWSVYAFRNEICKLFLNKRRSMH